MTRPQPFAEASRRRSWRPLAPRQRELLAAKCADLGNLAAASLIFGTLIREEALTLFSLVLGIALLALAYVLAVALSGRP